MPRQMKSHEDRELPRAGNHPARCCGVSLTGWQDGQFGLKEELLMSWELPTLLMADKKTPFVQTAFLPFNLGSESKGTKLAKFLWGWFPSWTDAQKQQARASIEKDATAFFKWLLGKVCFLSLVEKGDNVNIESLAAWPAGVPQTLPAAVVKPWYLDVEHPEDNIGTAPKWILERGAKAKRPDGTAAPVIPQNTGDFPFGANTAAGASGQVEPLCPEPGVDFPVF